MGSQDAERDAALRKLIGSRRLGALVTLKRDGRPQISNINYAYFPDEDTVRISVTDSRAKVRNARRDPRVSLHVMSEDGWQWAVAEGDAELSAVAAEPDDAAVEELITLYRAVQGEHPDWADYRAAMVRDQRLVLRLRIKRVYGQVGQG
ncbi:PPOX class F420-dependent oxidoreductase [Phaeacidiphilus oryzae]|uniref:PPOX class F420-dependent oxidoreductase n=1 Tax=Phaeacidiphilus oryzae TaxID=348818 RepID=UPI00055A4CF8|nr:PPOX class F420-dependent oxidoreductase [Phaeacidiphilus oryzae]